MSPRAPASASSSWLRRQQQTFGTPFLVCITTVYFAQGFRSLSGLSCQLLLKDTLGLDPGALEKMMAASLLPWSLKPLYGLLSDAFPVCGQRRRPYLAASAAVGVLAWAALALLSARLPHSLSSGEAAPLGLLLALLTAANLSTAVADVVVDAMVAEKAGEAAAQAAAGPGPGPGPEQGSASAGSEAENALQTLCWGALAVGGLLGSLLGMSFSAATPPWLPFLLTAVAPALALAAAVPLQEPAVHGKSPGPGAGAEGGARRVWRHLRALGGALRSPQVWRPLVYFFAQNAAVPSCAQAMMFFATDVLGFSPQFLAAQGVVAFLCMLVGSLVHERALQGLSFKQVFFRCQLAAALLSLSDVALACRLNQALGIPDAAFVMGFEAVGTVVQRAAMQPFLVAASRLCPEGCEGSLYAAFMSTYNFGHACSGALGAALLPLFHVAKGQYANLPQLLGLRTASMFIPLLLVNPFLGELDASHRPKTE